MPVFGKMRKDLSQMMSYLMRGPVKEMTQTLTQSRIPMMSRVGNALHKMMGGHVGDRSFDIFDWLPLVALLVATGLLLSGLFPTGLSTFGLNNGSLVLGRKDRAEEDETVLEQALGRSSKKSQILIELRSNCVKKKKKKKK